MEKISKCEASEFRRITLCMLNWYTSKTCVASELRKPQNCKFNLLHPHISHSSLTLLSPHTLHTNPCNNSYVYATLKFVALKLSTRKLATLKRNLRLSDTRANETKKRYEYRNDKSSAPHVLSVPLLLSMLQMTMKGEEGVRGGSQHR
jgi:hypothetical protein